MNARLVHAVAWGLVVLSPGACLPAQEIPQEKVLTNSIGMKMVLIPAGEFLMGSPDSDPDARDDEKPQHRVRIAKPFYLGMHEVTLGQFRRFADDTGYETDLRPLPGLEAPPQHTWRKPRFAQSDYHPVVLVTWNDADQFCRWLSRKEGRAYRLPTEAEWEYACRGGATTRFWCGDDPQKLTDTDNVADATFKAKHRVSSRTPILGKDGYVYTAPVGHFKANPFGLFDVHGNVWEWCADWYGAEYYRVSPQEDPTGPSSGESHVLRGGSWFTFGHVARSAARGRVGPHSSSPGSGFRVAWSP